MFGAEPGAVLRMVLDQALRPVAMGVAGAVRLAFLVCSWLRSLVFGFGMAAVASLGLGIAANATIFWMVSRFGAESAAGE